LGEKTLDGSQKGKERKGCPHGIMKTVELQNVASETVAGVRRGPEKKKEVIPQA